MLEEINRRTLLRAALPALAATSAAGAPAAKAKGVTIGYVTNEFRDFTNAELAKALSEQRVKVIQLFLTQKDSAYWKYNLGADVSAVTPERAREIAATYRSAGISIHSIGVYANLVHPDPAERKRQLAYFEAMMKIGEAMGVGRFLTEAGHFFDPKAPAPRVSRDWEEDVWRDTVATARELAKMADAHNATVLFEPYFIGFLATAKRTRLFLEAIGSPRMKVNLDPANIIEVNDLEEMFNQLQPYIESLHAKDRKLHVVKGAEAGTGDVDYVKLVRLTSERTPNAPLVLEYANNDTWKPALAYLRKAIKQAGLVEV